MKANEKTAGAIYQAARRLFARKGYEATTMDDIAALVGISKATLYRYVPGKEALRDRFLADLPYSKMRVRDVRAAILEAAMNLIGRVGFERASLDVIATTAGVSRAGVYWHFKGKDEVLAAIVAEYSPLPKIAETITKAEGKSLDALIRLVYEGYYDFIREHVKFFGAILNEMPTNPELTDIFRKSVVEPVSIIINDLLAINSIKISVPPQILLQVLMGPLILHLLMRKSMTSPTDEQIGREQLIDILINILFHGVL